MFDCDACRGRLAHDHRDGRECPHEFSSGDWRSCCAAESAKRVEMLAAEFRARRQPPEDARAVTLTARCECAEAAGAGVDPSAEEQATFSCVTGPQGVCRAWWIERLAAELLAEQIEAGLVEVPDDVSSLTATGELREG
ncbi:hypothetical protein Psed_0864 [Pseudonocardia dioxanivorans CB1190]|uniref:Uncharacterized protein n=1 Tax=Pseudonocardia dioxanivorans (strain ATCC 55486 / DSM 44775 / JCM 13855 / CB1190) TaxID=675635 RepID=F4CSE4_PSEUX|nr:hypothetical protein Psed_0864 [Pseudonocardia dioxanivorans CB1190]